MEAVLTNPFFLVFAFLTLTNVAFAISYYWYKARRAEIDAALKHEMLQRGMSADEIARVLAAPVRSDRPRPAASFPASEAAGPTGSK